MCTNCKTKASPCVGGLNCRPGYLCGVRSCQSAVIEKSNFIHVPFECLWRNSLTRTGNPDDLWMPSHKGGCLGMRGLWASLDGAGRYGRAGEAESEEGKYRGRGRASMRYTEHPCEHRGEKARVTQKAWGLPDRERHKSSAQPPSLLLPGFLWVSGKALPQEHLFLALFPPRLLHLSAFTASILLPC